MSSTCIHRFFSATEQNSTGVVTSTVPDLGVPAIEEFQEQLLGLAHERGWSRVEVDLRNVTFLGAAALGAFVALNKVLRARGGELTIRGVKGPLFDVFEVAHLEKLFDIHPWKEPHEAPPPRACLWPRGWPTLSR
jgi:anti-anti-sigma factor